jgi:NADH-quinone oxidoreductase subunit C
MTNDVLKAYLLDKFPSAEITLGTQYVQMIVASADLHQTATLLKCAKETSFDYLICLSGVDYPEYMEVVYHLESVSLRHVMVLKVRTNDRVNPAIDTVSDIWITAKYHEREVYDLLGIHFNNHTDLRRLFLEDGWGFPLRKDYVDEIRIVER